jgi:hypothetical protein
LLPFLVSFLSLVEVKSVRAFDIQSWIATWERWGTLENPRADGAEMFAIYAPYLCFGLQLVVACPSFLNVACFVNLGVEWCSEILTLCGIFLVGGLEFARLGGTLLHSRQYVPNVACVCFTLTAIFCVVCFEFMVSLNPF